MVQRGGNRRDGGGEGSQTKKKRRSSSDEEDDRLEEILANHQQRNVANWGEPGGSGSSSPRHGGSSRREQRSNGNGHRQQARAGGAGRYAAIARDTDRELKGIGSDMEEGEFNDSFHFDTEGDQRRALPPMPVENSKLQKPANTEQREQNGLLLPTNVLIEDSPDHAGDEGHTPEPPVDAAESDNRDMGEDHEGEMGNFVALDGGRAGPSARYYEAEEYEQRKALEECPTCGEKGHDKKSCPHLQCLACGALDDHATRECRQGVSCFRCGKLGHKSQECHASRRQAMPGRGSRDCMRCGSTRHPNASCPYLWRVYSFNDVEAHERFRKAKWQEVGKSSYNASRSAQPKLGSHNVGGFEYRSEDSDSEEDGQVDDRNGSTGSAPPHDWDPVERWCYNCAAQGDHWGDDCPLPRCNPIRPSGDHSAYSEVMAQHGPLARQYASSRSKNQARTPAQFGSSHLDYIDNFQAGPHASIHVFDPPSGPRGAPSASRRNDTGASARPPMRQHEYRSKGERRRDDAQRAMPNALEARLSLRSEPQHGKSKDNYNYKKSKERSDGSKPYVRPRERKRAQHEDDFVPLSSSSSSFRYPSDSKSKKNRRAPSPTPSLDGGHQGSRRKQRRHRHRT